MSARNAMTMRALVQRGTSSVDGSGLPGPATWATLHRALPCRLWTTGEREIIDGGKTVLIADHRALVPQGTDIHEADRLTLVADRVGNSLVSNTMQVRAVIRRKGHIELRLEEVA